MLLDIPFVFMLIFPVGIFVIKIMNIYDIKPIFS